MTGGIELPNQGKIRMLGEKETYRYWGILETDTIEEAEMKEKNWKKNTRERESYSKPSYITGTS